MLAKILAQRHRRIMVKVVSSSQNASEEGRSIFYVEVVANRMFGSRMKNK